MPMQARPGGSDHWYSPDRDLLNIWPSMLIKSAVYADDPRSSICQWLSTQVPVEDVHKRIRAQLQTLIVALKTGKSANLEDILPADSIDWPVFQAIMFAAGIMAFKMYNKYYQGARLVNVNGGGVQQDPVGTIDELGVMVEFDRMTSQFRR